MRKRIAGIDFLRAIAFVLVFISHVPRLNFSHNPFGVAGVSLFFVLSGFVGYCSRKSNESSMGGISF